MKIWMKNFFAAEGAKLREMTIGEKWQYIWEYYKLQIIILMIAVVVILVSIFTSSDETYLYGAWFGTPVHQEQMIMLGERLSVIAEEEGYAVLVTTYLETGNPEHDMALSTRFVAMMQAGMIDVFFASNDALIAYAGMGAFVPIQELMDEAYLINPALHSELYERLHTISFVDWDGIDQTETVAISLAGSPMLAEVFIPTDDLYLAIIINSDNMHRIVAALEVLLP